MRDFKIYGILTVGPKGQVVIPAEARESFNINPGDKVAVAGSAKHKAIVIIEQKVLEEHLGKLDSSLKQACAVIDYNKKDIEQDNKR